MLARSTVGRLAAAGLVLMFWVFGACVLAMPASLARSAALVTAPNTVNFSALRLLPVAGWAAVLLTKLKKNWSVPLLMLPPDWARAIVPVVLEIPASLATAGKVGVCVSLPLGLVPLK